MSAQDKDISTAEISAADRQKMIDFLYVEAR